MWESNFRESEDHRRSARKGFSSNYLSDWSVKTLILTISMQTMRHVRSRRQSMQKKLAFLTDIEGVYLDPNDPSTLLSKLFVKEAKELIDNGNVGGGMIPKLQNCIDAIEEGVSRVHILDGRIPHCLLLEIFTNKGIGTAILRKDEIKDYDVQ